jgi:hypothetical protein
MSSVPEHLTIIDCIVSAGWLPQKCTICNAAVEFVWQGYRPLCRRCACFAPQAIQVHLRRVQDIRRLLGFGEDDAGTSVRQALRMHEGDPPPPVVGHPLNVTHNLFANVSLPPGYTCEMYCVHGLSRWTPDELNNIAVLKSTALRFQAIPAQAWSIARHDTMKREIANAFALIGEEPPDLPPPQSEVLVVIGIAVIPDSHPYARYLLAWNPAAPWSGYFASEHRIQHLTDAQLAKLRKAGKQFTTKRTQKGAPAGPRIPKQRLIDRMTDIASELGKHPTAKEFRGRFYQDQDDPRSLDVKTLRDTHKYYGWESYPDLVNDVLGPKTKSG